MGAPRAIRGGGVRRWRLLPAALAALLLVAVPLAPPAFADDGDQQRLERLAKDKQELERAIQVSRQNTERYRQEALRFQSAVSAANARIAELAAQQDQAQSAADTLKIDIAIAEEQLALVAFQLSETQSLIDSLKAQAAEHGRQLAQREQIYAVHLRATYKQAQISPLEMLLSARSLTDFVGRVQAMVFISRQDTQLVSEIRALKGNTTYKQLLVAEKEQEIVGLRQQMDAQKASLEKKKADYEAVVEQMKAGIVMEADLRYEAGVNRDQAAGLVQQANAETAALNKRLEQTEAAYAALAAEMAARSGLAVFTGKMVVWPVVGPITSGFGPRWGGFHNGMDIAAPMYTPIRTGAAGQVVTVGKPYLAYGDTATVVIVAHGRNFSTLYGHMDDSKPPTVRVGQFVTSGTVIGYVGMTGWTTGPHLHFMTIVDGRAVDPRPYMP